MNIQEIIALYAKGHFLMDNGEGLGWYRSRVHALIPLDERFHVHKSLRRAVNSGRFEARINGDFAATVENCANRGGRFDAEVWISEDLREIYLALHRAGIAHSFEMWQEGKLAGGVLGLALGGVFIGESMFYSVPEASKVAMVRLVEHLRSRGFEYFDAQIQNPHLARFGAYEIPEKEFLPLLAKAVRKPIRFV
jgi:leucyl/phenylalanyl-tRNA---protein transferase